METNFAVSLAPPPFDLHWGKCVERIANGNVGIKMVYGESLLEPCEYNTLWKNAHFLPEVPQV